MFIVERATEDDLEAVLSLHRMLIAGTAIDLVTAIRKRHCWIARQGAVYCGYALAYPALFDRWFIHRIAIHPDYAAHAVDMALVNYLLKTCPDDRLFACVPVDDVAGNARYERLDFTYSGDLSGLIDDADVKFYYKHIQ